MKRALRTVTSHTLVSVWIQDDTEVTVKVTGRWTSLQVRLIYAIEGESSTVWHRLTQIARASLKKCILTDSQMYEWQSKTMADFILK